MYERFKNLKSFYRIFTVFLVVWFGATLTSKIWVPFIYNPITHQNSETTFYLKDTSLSFLVEKNRKNGDYFSTTVNFLPKTNIEVREAIPIILAIQNDSVSKVVVYQDVTLTGEKEIRFTLPEPDQNVYFYIYDVPPLVVQKFIETEDMTAIQDFYVNFVEMDIRSFTT